MDIQQEIRNLRQEASEYKRQRGNVPVTVPFGTTRADLDGVGKVQLALDGLLGVREALGNRNCRPFRTLPEAYKCISGEPDLSNVHRGGLYRVSQSLSLVS